MQVLPVARVFPQGVRQLQEVRLLVMVLGELVDQPGWGSVLVREEKEQGQGEEHQGPEQAKVVLVVKALELQVQVWVQQP